MRRCSVSVICRNGRKASPANHLSEWDRPPLVCPRLQLNIFTTGMEGKPQGELCWPQQAICASFFNISSIITPGGGAIKRAYPLQNPRHHCALATYHKPRRQQCIQRMQPTKGTHHWLHSSQRAETHTCHPGGEKEKTLIIGSMKWKERPSQRSSRAIKTVGRVCVRRRGGGGVGERRCQKLRRRMLAPDQQRESSTGAGTSLKRG